MDGIWTYTIPLRASGGVLVIRDGKVAGGDGTYVCTGTCEVEGDTIRLELLYDIFNPQGTLGTAWGDGAAQIETSFEGTTVGDVVSGKSRRPGFDQEFDVMLMRYRDC